MLLISHLILKRIIEIYILRSYIEMHSTGKLSFPYRQKYSLKKRKREIKSTQAKTCPLSYVISAIDISRTTLSRAWFNAKLDRKTRRRARSMMSNRAISRHVKGQRWSTCISLKSCALKYARCISHATLASDAWQSSASLHRVQEATPCTAFELPAEGVQ